MKPAWSIVVAGGITAALLGIPKTAPAQVQSATPPTQNEVPTTIPGWVAPDTAFDESIQQSFIHNEFLTASMVNEYPPKAVMGFTSIEGCPDDWKQLIADDGTPLFYAFGLLVDADGTQRTGYVRVPACVKQ